LFFSVGGVSGFKLLVPGYGFLVMEVTSRTQTSTTGIDSLPATGTALPMTRRFKRQRLQASTTQVWLRQTPCLPQAGRSA